jgi:hypothetical protein
MRCAAHPGYAGVGVPGIYTTCGDASLKGSPQMTFAHCCLNMPAKENAIFQKARLTFQRYTDMNQLRHST